jgi:glycosyltransferase involved in cell wall biosynthesis
VPEPVLVFHPGTQHSRQTALALQQLGRLDRLATSLFFQPDRWPYRVERWLPEPLRARVAAEFRRFDFPGLDPALVRTTGVAEWLERIARRTGRRALADRLDALGNRRFAHALRRDIAGPRAFALWGFDASSLHAFRAARAAGRRCILDRTIGDWRRYNQVMERAHALHPDCFPAGPWRVPAARIARDDEEYALADRIVTGGPVAAESVRTHAADPSVAARVTVVPNCYDERLFGALPPPRPRPPGTPLRLLFLGQAGVRKGLPLLLEAVARIPASVVSLTVTGDMQLPPAYWSRFRDRVSHRRTVPRSEVPALMRAHDLLVLPSWFEGSAVVLPEALAAGLGLIQTRAAGLGVSPETGIELAEPDADALEAAIVCAAGDPALVEAWRQAAPEQARRHSFAAYRAGVGALLDEMDALDQLQQLTA